MLELPNGGKSISRDCELSVQELLLVAKLLLAIALESDNDTLDTIALFQALVWKHKDALLLADCNGSFQDANKATDSFLVVV